MARGLTTTLMVGLMASASALRTSLNSTSMLAATVTEAGRRCSTEDWSGMMEVLKTFGAPLGVKHGKELMQACFMSKSGECLVGEAQCAWMHKCFAVDGPCEQPPIKESFLEIPGGQVVFAELASHANISHNSNSSKDSKMDVFALQMSSLLDGIESLQKQMPKHTYTHSPLDFAADYAKQVEATAKYELWVASGARKKFMSYFPEAKKRLWFYQLASMSIWYVLACAMEYSNVKMLGPGGTTLPVYAWFAPQGIYAKGSAAYTHPIISTKLDAFSKWQC